MLGRKGLKGTQGVEMVGRAIFKSTFRLKFAKLKPQLSQQPIGRKENSLKSQSNLKVKQPKFPKRGKTRVNQSWSVSALHLIGWKSGVGFLGQS